MERIQEMSYLGLLDGSVPARLLYLLQDQRSEETETLDTGDNVTVDYNPDRSQSGSDNQGTCIKPRCV